MHSTFTSTPQHVQFSYYPFKDKDDDSGASTYGGDEVPEVRRDVIRLARRLVLPTLLWHLDHKRVSTWPQNSAPSTSHGDDFADRRSSDLFGILEVTWLPGAFILATSCETSSPTDYCRAGVTRKPEYSSARSQLLWAVAKFGAYPAINWSFTAQPKYHVSGDANNAQFLDRNYQYALVRFWTASGRFCCNSWICPTRLSQLQVQLVHHCTPLFNLENAHGLRRLKLKS